MGTTVLQDLAPAKVNLSLRITGRRPDGYHLLDSIVAFTDFGDTVTVEPSDSLSLEVDGPHADGIPTDDGNLVIRAAQALARATGTGRGAAIRLTKYLPAAGGIGGGSSDAATTLRLLCRLWEVSLPPKELAALALTLGADVPVCLEARPRHMSGIGEKLGVLPPFPKAGIVLVNPGSPCPTPDVFRARSGPFSTPALPMLPGHSAHALARALTRERNDLTEAAVSICPEIRAVLSALRDAPGTLLYRMSGSGATCFALYETPDKARAAAAKIAREEWWVASGGLA